MVAYNKFDQFVEDLCKGVHQLHAAGHTLKVYATNNAPSATADATVSDLAGITEENGYAPVDVENDFSEAAGTGTLTATDKVWTASGGSFGPLQFVPLFNDTPTSPADPLIGWWDYGSAVTVNTGETFTVNFGASVFTIS
jgi:hypothetical protein